ncbi:MAG TPA: hypothetical protein VL991_03240 [Terracidiphilus sp.]|nr:hypothetical protein [Terracidiphilus sp.]
MLTAILLYPNEEGKMQSKLEDVWVRMDDYQRLALSRHAAFMTGVAKLETRILDNIFGKKLISAQALGMSFCCSFTLISLAAFNAGFLFGLGAVSCCVGAGVLSVCLRRKPRKLAWWLAFVFLLAGLLVWAMSNYAAGSEDSRDYAGEMTAALFVAILVSYACDITFISITRSLVRWAGEMTSSLKVLGLVAVNLLLALTLLFSGVAPGFILRTRDPNYDVSCSAGNAVHVLLNCALPFVSWGNLFDTLLALLFVALAVVLLVHRAFWPLLCRTLFRLHEVGTEGRRAILVALGFGLVGWSGVQVPDWLRDLAKALAS